MAHDRADDTSRFMNAIAAFSAAPEKTTICGRLVGTEAGSLVDAIVAEVNETVLRRILHFTTPEGSVLSLDVSERRVYRLHALPRSLEAKYAHLLQRNLTAQDAAQFLEIAEELSQTSSTLYAKASLPEAGDAAGFEALSMWHVLAAKENAVKMSNLPAEFAHAIPKARECALALCVRSDGTSLLRSGNAEHCDALEQASDASVAGTEAKPLVRLWDGAIVADHAFLLATMDGSSMAMLVPTSQISEQFALWRRVVLKVNQD